MTPHQYRQQRKALLARQFAEIDPDHTKDSLVASFIELDPQGARDAIVASWEAGERAEQESLRQDLLDWVAANEQALTASATAMEYALIRPPVPTRAAVDYRPHGSGTRKQLREALLRHPSQQCEDCP